MPENKNNEHFESREDLKQGLKVSKEGSSDVKPQSILDYAEGKLAAVELPNPELDADLQAVHLDSLENFPAARRLRETDPNKFDAMYRSSWNSKDTGNRRWNTVNAVENSL